MVSLSGDSTEDCSANAGMLPPLNVIFKRLKNQITLIYNPIMY